MVQSSAAIYISPGIVGPDVLEMVSEFISLICISLLAVAIGSKTYRETLKTINYGRFMTINIYLLSWAFAFTSAVVVSTNNNNMVSCTLAMLSCDIFYAGSKIVIYAWLIERVYLVTAVKTPRFKSCLYKSHLVMLCPYIIIFALMLTYRNIYLEEDGKCTIGLQLIASIPLLVYDFLLNLYLSWLFIAPLMNIGLNTKHEWKKSRIYKLATRTLFASIVSLLISFANVLVVVITHGHERGLTCLTMCTVDVTINAVTVYWVTTNNHKTDNKDMTNRSKTYTTDIISNELAFDAMEPEDRDKHKFDFASIQLDRDSKMRDDSSTSDSIRSTQISHSSANPLHGY